MKFPTKWTVAVLLVSQAFGQAPKKPIAKQDFPLELWREAPLPTNAKQALALSDASLAADVHAEAAPDGRVILRYGSGTPTLICGLLKITEVDLEPGESIQKDGVDVGDEPEFHVITRHAGSGLQGYDYLVVKPIAQDVETTMTVGTDKRVYYLRLRSTESQFMTRVAFSYPEEELARAKALQEALKRAQTVAAAPTEPPAPPLKTWKYTVKKHGQDADYLMPLSVGDDGVHTHIALSQEARVRGLPVLQIRDAAGPIPANSHWEENTLIVDALFKDGCLLQGVGKKQQRVCIHNEMLGKGAQSGNN